MCKFNNRLFVFALYCLLCVVSVLAMPLQDSPRNSAEDLGALMALSALMNSQDVHYDQRQKGEENYRIKLDGFFIGIPQEDTTALLLLTDDVFESLDDDNLLAFGKNKNVMTPTTLSASSSLSQSDTAFTPSVSESNQNLSSNADATSYNIPPMLVEIPVSRKYLESRHSVDAVSRTKSYISHFLNLLKRIRKH